MAKAPLFLKKYFWDIDFAKLDPKKHSVYTIERLLEFGDEKAVRWILQTFSKKQIRETVCQSRAISSVTANFWSLILGIPKENIRCLEPQFLKIRNGLWPY